MELFRHILHTKKTDGQTELFLKLLLRLKRERQERDRRETRERIRQLDDSISTTFSVYPQLHFTT